MSKTIGEARQQGPIGGGTCTDPEKPGGEPREHDVVCEKGRGDHERWPGNKLYRHLVKINKESYNDRTPMERSEVIGKIIATVREKNGWFVTLDEETAKWTDLNEEKVRKKVSDDLRREVRRRREKRSNNTVFSAKLRALKEKEEGEPARDILQPVDDPRPTDVLFGAGARRHPGNKTYWHLMKLNLDHYIISPYGARSMISRSIVQGIRDQNGRFLEQDPKTAVWYEISDRRAIEKTSHALSNKKYKTRKRLPDSPSSQLSPAGGRILESFTSKDGKEYGDSIDSTIPPTSPIEDPAKTKQRTKKHRLLQRMEEPKPIVGLVVESRESFVAKKVSPSASPDLPASPVSDISSSSGKVGTPESSPYGVQTHTGTTSEYPMEDPPVVSPNDSRASPSSERSYEGDQLPSAFARYYRPEEKESASGLRRYSHNMVDIDTIYQHDESRYEEYHHPEERHRRESHLYRLHAARLREHPHPQYVERVPTWHPPGETSEYPPSWRARHSPFYSVVSPRALKGGAGRVQGSSGWVHMSEWEAHSPRHHPEPVQRW